jgi:hypothetical protein
MLIELEVIKASESGMREIEIADADIEDMTATGVSGLIERGVKGDNVSQTHFVIHPVKHCESLVTSAV